MPLTVAQLIEPSLLAHAAQKLGISPLQLQALHGTWAGAVPVDMAVRDSASRAIVAVFFVLGSAADLTRIASIVEAANDSFPSASIRAIVVPMSLVPATAAQLENTGFEVLSF